MELDHASGLPDILFKNLLLYLHHVPVIETLPPKTRGEKRLDRTYWAHDPEEPLDSPVVVHVPGGLLVAVRNIGLANEPVHLTHCTLAGRRVDILEWWVYRGSGKSHLADAVFQIRRLCRDIDLTLGTVVISL